MYIYVYIFLIGACRNDIKKIMRMLVTIQQLLLDVNPNYSQESTNLNLPVETPEALEEFNNLMMQDSVSLLQYVSTFHQ
jgi:hypothetical protein